MKEKSLLLNKEMLESGFLKFEFWNKVDKVNFDSGFDKNNPKVCKGKSLEEN